jgi:predicted metalloprotease with PDZ domain
LAPGDELIAVGGWRIRRLDDALRTLAGDGATPFLVGRDQRVLTIAVAAASLAGSGAVQLELAEKADADARRRREAWIGG